MTHEEVLDLFKKNRVLLYIIALSFVVLMGSTYAWYTISIESSKEHTIKAGNLELVFEDKKESVTLTNAVPQKDSEGKKNPSYDFLIANTGSINSRYEVYLEDIPLTVGSARMSDSVLKYVLMTNNEVVVSEGFLNTLDVVRGRRKLVGGILDANASVTYSLIVWIDENATSEISGQEFITKLSIEGKQVKEVVEE